MGVLILYDVYVAVGEQGGVVRSCELRQEDLYAARLVIVRQGTDLYVFKNRDGRAGTSVGVMTAEAMVAKSVNAGKAFAADYPVQAKEIPPLVPRRIPS